MRRSWHARCSVGLRQDITAQSILPRSTWSMTPESFTDPGVVASRAVARELRRRRSSVAKGWRRAAQDDADRAGGW
jgi:hypothetical protein